MVIDESHQTVPQLGAMFKGDQSRRGTLRRIRFSSAVGQRTIGR